MTGVAKNHRCSRWPTMFWMSRKCTVRAERKKARPSERTSWTRIGSGSRSAVHASLPFQARKANRIGRPSRKCARFASTVTVGRTSAGKSTFLIRLPLAMMTPEDSASEPWSQVQGRMPQKRKRK
jgi:hypothetical protein